MGPQKPQPQNAVQDFIDFGNDRNLRKKALMDTARFVRRSLGKNHVEENLEKTLPKVKLQLKDFFVLKMADTLKKKKGRHAQGKNLILFSTNAGITALFFAFYHSKLHLNIVKPFSHVQSH